MANPTETLGKSLNNLAERSPTGAGISYAIARGDTKEALGRALDIPFNLMSSYLEKKNPSSAVHKFMGRFTDDNGHIDLRLINKRGFFSAEISLRQSLLNRILYQQRKGESTDGARFQFRYNIALINYLYNLKPGDVFVCFLPHDQTISQGVALAIFRRGDNGVDGQTHLLPQIDDKDAQQLLTTLEVNFAGSPVDLKDDKNSPLWKGVVTSQSPFDFVQKPNDFRNWVSGVLGPNVWQRPIPTCQNCQVNSQPGTVENSTLTYPQVERTRESVSLIQRVDPAGPEPLLRPPVLMFRNNRTEEPADNNSGDKEGPSNPRQPTPPFSPESPPAASPAFVLMFQNIYTKPKIELPQEAQEAVQKTREKQARVELPTNPLEVRATVQPQGLTLSLEKQGKIEVAVAPRILPDQVRMEPGVAMEQERVIFQEVVVKKEEVEKETITVPLIEIPEVSLIVKVELEPLCDEPMVVTSILQSIENLPAVTPVESVEDLQPQSLTSKIEEAVGSEGKYLIDHARASQIRHKDEAKIFLVRNFKIEHRFSKIINMNNKHEEATRARKLVWVIKMVAVEVLELEGDQKRRLHVLLHSLRKVVTQVFGVFGEDILRARQLRAIRADEPEPVDVIREIEYYLELLKGVRNAQVFAFVS